MMKSINSKRQLSLAQHYVNSNYELLSDIKVLEYDEENDTYSWIFPQSYWLAIEYENKKAFIIFNEENDSFKLAIQNGRNQKEIICSVVEDAVIKIDKELLRNGNILYINSEIKNLIESI